MSSDINRSVDKVYVLTIPRNSDRVMHVKSILKDIDFEFWNGFDAPQNYPGKMHVGEIDDIFFIENDIDKAYASRFTIGQLGAYFSIKKMINHIADNGFERVLIFEDDMLPLRTDWKDIFLKSLLELPSDWDVLLVGYIYDGSVYKFAYDRKIRFLAKVYHSMKSFFRRKNVIKPHPVKFSKHLDISGFCLGGHAYCLSKKGAKVLSSYLSPMQDSGDVLISRLVVENKIKAYSVYPCLFLQDKKFVSKTKVS